MGCKLHDRYVSDMSPRSHRPRRVSHGPSDPRPGPAAIGGSGASREMILFQHINCKKKKKKKRKRIWLLFRNWGSGRETNTKRTHFGVCAVVWCVVSGRKRGRYILTSVMMTATSPARTPKEPTARSTLLASNEARPSEHCPIALAAPTSATSAEQASRRAAPSGTRGASGDTSHAARGPKHSSSRSRAAHAPLPQRCSCQPRRVAASTACAATASKSDPSHSTCAQG